MPALIEPTKLKAWAKKMTIGLFIPCYVDLIYPKVGIAALGFWKSSGSMSTIPSIKLAADSRCPIAAAKPMPRRQNAFFLAQSSK
jgi:hypothetical protein